MGDIVIYIIGGFFAGIATGLIGLSAATIIAPLFFVVLGMDSYTAIGIALASDVLASSLSAYYYIKNKNIHLKSAIVMAITVVLFTILASYLSSNTDSNRLGIMVNVFLVLLGIRFLVFPVKGNADGKIFQFTKSKFFASVFWGILIGLSSGYFGAGGGLSMLAVLTLVLKYDLKKAVGTSVFIMVFTAFVGATTHIIFDDKPIMWSAIFITGGAALIGANIASKYANRVNNKILNITVGSSLTALGIVLIIVYIFK